MHKRRRDFLETLTAMGAADTVVVFAFMGQGAEYDGLQYLLPQDWEQILRTGLFLSPTLVMNLNAGEGGDRHNPISSAIGLSVALSAASRPVTGEDMFTRFFDAVRPE